MGRTTTKKLFHLSHGYLKDSLDAGPTEDGFSNLKSNKGYRGPYSPPDPGYLGSTYNLLIEWEPGEITGEPLTTSWLSSSIAENSKQGFVTHGNHMKEPTETLYS